MGPLMLDVQAFSLTADESVLLSQPEVGGLILFTRNYQDRRQLAELVADIRRSQPGILIAVDQEGGRVQRFRQGFESLPSLQKIGQLASIYPEQTEDIASTLGWLMAADILCADVDISLAPILDLDTHLSQVIGDRSFSADSASCIRLASAYIKGMHDAGMGATAKHFPGHGAVREDSHLELPRDPRELSQVIETDMRPFAALAPHYDAVMPGHILFPNIDDLPVGFSPFWLQSILRQKLGFQGVIFSDDLSMEGAAESGSYAERAALALNAGCDMVLACNNSAGAAEVLEWLQQNPQPQNARLERMRSRRQWDLNTMHADPRYKRAHQYLDQISDLE